MKKVSIKLRIYQLRHLCYLSISNTNYRDQSQGVKRSVSEISWHPEGPIKAAVSYAISRF